MRGLRARQLPKQERQTLLAAGELPRIAERTLFDDLGVTYAGPFDGHDVEELVDAALALARHEDGPIILHVLTGKGHGYAPAERAADHCHGVAKFDVATGTQKKSPPAAPSYTSVFASALICEAERDDKNRGCHSSDALRHRR